MVGSRLLLLSAMIALVCATDKLHVVVLGPFPDPVSPPGFEGGPAVVAAARVAANHINNRTDILQDYELKVLQGDSGCGQQLKATLAFVETIFYSGKNVVGIIGPSCSASTLTIAPLGARDSISLIQIATGTSPLLNDETLTNTFRAVSSSLVYVDSFLKLMEFNNWRRVAILFDGIRLYFKSTFQEFQEKLKADTTTVTGFVSAVYDTFLPLEEIQQKNIRIILNFLDVKRAAKLACLAYHLNMTYPTYQWVFIDRSVRNFNVSVSFVHNGKKYTCNADETLSAMHGAILNQYQLASTDVNSTDTISGISYTDFREQLIDKLEQDMILAGQNVTAIGNPTNYANIYYDAFWSLALALNNSIPEITGRNLSLSNYSYGNCEITSIIRDNLQDVEFKGIAGRMMFQNDTRDAQTTIDLFAIQRDSKGKEIQFKIGYFDHNLTFTNIPPGTFVNDTFTSKPVTIHIAAGVLALIATVAILCVTVVLQIMHIKYYYLRAVKATSPNLTHLIFSGCYVISIAAVIFVVQSTMDFTSTESGSIAYGTLCNAFTWCFIMGYSLIFGTMCAKSWRVYRIFHHFRSQTLSGACIADEALVAFVILLLFIDIILGLFWNVEDPWILKTTEEFDDTDKRMPVILTQSSCDCENLLVWVGILAAYKGTITMIVVALAISLRRIKRKEFKHTKKINLLVYVLTLVEGVCIPLYYVLQSISTYISFIIMCVFLNTIVLLCIFLLFMPPFAPMCKHRFHTSPAVIKYRRWKSETVLV